MAIYRWLHVAGIEQKGYVCGFCGKNVGPSTGYSSDQTKGKAGTIYICPFCNSPTFFDFNGKQTPGVRLGHDVDGITDEGVRVLYNEARDCAAAGCYTAAVLVCRKILMHLAVVQGAEPGVSFLEYVDFLQNKGFVPPNGKTWVDKIRTFGNDANHQIKIMNEAESRMIIAFVEMLLRFMFEFPALVVK